MMMKTELILNEKKFIENLINDDLAMITDKPKQIIEMLATYYHQTNEKNLTEKLIDFLKDRYPKYNENKRFWRDYCTRINAKTINRKLLECDEIPITEKEYATIKELDYLPDLTGAERKALQRLLFTILALGKFQNLKSPNFGYISSKYLQIKTIDLFQIARVTGNKEQRLLMLNQLYNLKLIDFPKSYNDNCRATFIDNDTTNAAMIITDMRELGYQWNEQRGDNFNHCQKCNVIVKTNSGKDGLCSECAEIAKQSIARCIDCNTLFPRQSKRKERCDSCQSVRNLEKRLTWQRLKRSA